MDLKNIQKVAEAEAQQWKEDCIHEVFMYFFIFINIWGILLLYFVSFSFDSKLFHALFQGLDPETSFLEAACLLFQKSERKKAEKVTYYLNFNHHAFSVCL